LTEEQRQQIIAKLLAERRSQAANAASRQQQVELPPEERAARLQELMNRRAAAKQQQGEHACVFDTRAKLHSWCGCASAWGLRSSRDVTVDPLPAETLDPLPWCGLGLQSQRVA
jgi:hypothetical protein